jgi:alpha-L-fucosidase 2
VSDGKLIVSGADEATLYLTAGTNFKNYNDVSGDPATMSQRPLQTLRTKRFDAVKAAHIKDYQTYFNTLTLDLGTRLTKDFPPMNDFNNSRNRTIRRWRHYTCNTVGIC